MSPMSPERNVTYLSGRSGSASWEGALLITTHRLVRCQHERPSSPASFNGRTPDCGSGNERSIRSAGTIVGWAKARMRAVPTLPYRAKTAWARFALPTYEVGGSVA